MENELVKTLLENFGTPEEQETFMTYVGTLLSLSDKTLDMVGPTLREVLVSRYGKHDLKEELERGGYDINDLETFEELVLLLLQSIDQMELRPKQRDFFKGVIDDFYNAVIEQFDLSASPVHLGVHKLTENARLPIYAHANDSGMDVYTTEDVHLNPGETKVVSTGLSFEVPVGYELQIRPRSGLSLKTPLRVANSPATIDASYRGEVKVIVHNTTSPIQDIQYSYDDQQNIVIESIITGESIEFSAGSKIAQLILCKVEKATFVECDELSSTNRGEGGFGSTGV